jgi:hypothetical protein
LGIGTTTPANKLDISGAAAIGASYSGTSSAPANGLIVQGDVGIGIAAPTRELHINNGSATFSYMALTSSTTGNTVNDGLHVGISGTTAFIRNFEAGSMHFRTDNTNRLVIAATGEIGIGTTTPSYSLELATNSAAKPTSNTWTVTSDARLKKDIRPYESGLSDLLKIEPVWFTYNGKAGLPEETGVGVIAQDIQKIAPYMVNHWTYTNTREITDENGEEIIIEGKKEEYLGVDNGAMTYMLINAVKEQQAMIEQLQAEIEMLKSKK